MKKKKLLLVVDKERKKTKDTQYTTNYKLPYSFTENENHSKHQQLISTL